MAKIRQRFDRNNHVPEISHRELVKKAEAYLRNTDPHTVVLTELRTAATETPDAIGWKYGDATVIECKASRADFLADANKFFREHPEQGVGYYRYYMAPYGMLSADEIPANWGLIDVDRQEGGRLVAHVTKKAERLDSCNRAAEVAMLISTIRRLEISCAVFVREEKELEAENG